MNLHPDYIANTTNYEKWRAVLIGGSYFIDRYLQYFSHREDMASFNTRKTVTYCPSHAKAALYEVRNAIQQRLVDVKRIGGPDSYQQAIAGLNGGVDLDGATMSSFMGRYIILELLALGKVGVYIDRGAIAEGASVLETKKKRPYLYYYTAENILNWAYDENNQLTSVLLRDSIPIYDEEGLVKDYHYQYRLLRKEEGQVHVSLYDNEYALITETVLPLSTIPLVIFELSDSLLTDAADYQIALLNIASADNIYAIKANFPIYTEQVDFRTQSLVDKQEKDVAIGVTQGRAYGPGLERPAFINPSPDPLRASMEKQEALIKELRQLMQTTIINLTAPSAQRVSAESKAQDYRTLEAGLATIGTELAYGEQKIAEIWAEYEGSGTETITIKYPRDYSLKTDTQRQEEAATLAKLIPLVPSQYYQRILAKEIVNILLAHKLGEEELEDIYNEIEQAPVIITDPTIIKLDHEAGFLSTEMAAKLRGYGEQEAQRAKEEYIERLKHIAEAQVQGVQHKRFYPSGRRPDNTGTGDRNQE